QRLLVPRVLDAYRRQHPIFRVRLILFHFRSERPMLRAAYLFNILVFVPVGLTTLLSPASMKVVFENKVQHAPELRILVGCLWTAIVVCSLIGLAEPHLMIGVLILQVVYKVLFLALVVFPLIARRGLDAIPLGVAATSALIVLVWPIVIYTGLTG